MARLLVILLVVNVAAMLFLLVRREWMMWRARRAHHALFRLDRDGPALRAESDMVLAALGRRLVESPEIEAVPALSSDAAKDARAAVTAAAARFGFDLTGVEIVAQQHARMPGAAGVAVLPARPYSMSITADRIDFTVDESAAPSTPVIHVAPSARASAELLQAVAAHEVAHHVLGIAGLGLSPGAADERRTDLALILAGYGPLLERLGFRQSRQFGPGAAISWTTHTWSPHSLGAIRYLRAYRAELAKLSTAGSAS